MVNNGNSQRIVPIILILIVIIVAVAAVISVGRGIFGGSSSSEPAVDPGQAALLNTTVDRSVRLTVRGPIVGDNTFRSYTIAVSPTFRTLTTYQGYLDSQLETAQLANNTQGYDEFVHALDRAGLASGKELKGEADDRRGICAMGKLYVYEILQGSTAVKTLWTTTCGSTKGSLKASNQSVLQLFRAQIPEASKLTGKINL